MNLLTNFKKFGVNATVLATSISLVACGGGGSDGYFEQSNNGNTNNGGSTGKDKDQTQLKEVAALIQSSFDEKENVKNNISRKGDILIVKLQAVDVSGGGVGGREVKLSIRDFEKYGITSDGSVKTTDEQGYATFTIKIPVITADIKKIILTGQVVGTNITQVHEIGITGGTESVAQSKLEAVFDPITAINVTGGTTTVRVRARDTNGGGVSNQKISLVIPKEVQNLLSITGTSETITDTNGYVTFTLKLLDGKEANRKELLEKGIVLSAILVDSEGAVATQETNLKIRSSVEIVDQIIFDTEISNNKINASAGSAVVAVKILNPEGLPVKNQKVKLEIIDSVKAVGAELTLVNATTYGANIDEPIVTTDEKGIARFDVTVAANDTSVQKLLAEYGITLKATVVDVLNKTTVQQHKLTAVANMNEAVSNLTFLTSHLDISEGEGKVTIKAVDEYGGAVENQNVTLSITDSERLGVISNSSSSQKTNEKGEVTFDLVFNKLGNEDIFKELIAKGVNIQATHINSKNKTITQIQKLALTSKTDVQDPMFDIQRLELKSSKGVVSAKGGEFEITVRAINNAGEYAANKIVAFALNDTAIKNGVIFEGSNTQSTKSDGTATFKVKTNAANAAAIETLVKSGIGIGVSTVLADKTTVTNSMLIQVQDVTVETPESNVAYLAIDSLTQDEILDVTKSGKVTIKVRALNAQGGSLANQTVKLEISNLNDLMGTNASGGRIIPVALQGGSEKPTDADGYATFTLSYSVTENEDIISKLTSGSGVRLTASVGTKRNITQVYFKNSNNASNIQLERIQILADKGSIEATGNKIVTFTIQAFNTDGSPAQNQTIGLGLNEVAVQNGVTFVGGQSVVTGTDGSAKFTINVNAQNIDAIKNLVQSGITLGTVHKRTDGTSVSNSYRVMVTEPALPITLVEDLKVEAGSASVSGLGGEVTVAVRAVDGNGTGLEGKTVAFALTENVSSRVAVNTTSAVTNTQGYAYFKLTVAPGSIEEDLVKSGITYAVSVLNSSNGTSKSQVNKIQVTVPQQALDVSLSKSKETVSETGDTLDIGIKVVSNNIKISGYPVNLEVVDGNINGIKLDAVTYSVDSNGNAKAVLTVPANLTQEQRNRILENGITIIATITLPSGEKRGVRLSVPVSQVINENHITIQRSKTSLVNTGDSALVTVKLLDDNNGGVKEQPVTLRLEGNPDATIRGASSAVTNEFGEAVFEVTVPENAATSQVNLLATHVNAAGKQVRQPSTLTVRTPQAQAPQLVLKFLSNKNRLNVRGDQVEISVLVSDTDGTSVAGKAVTLSLPNNLGYISGPSTVESDASGFAKFNVILDERLLNQNDVNDLLANGFNLNAVVIDENNLKITQPFSLEVARTVVQTQGSIAVNINPTEIERSVDGIYYIVNGSAQLVDVDGKPLANQEVTLDTRPTQYRMGEWRYAIQQNPWERTEENGIVNWSLIGNYPFADLKAWVAPNDFYYPFTTDGFTPTKELARNEARECSVNTISWTANAKALRVVRFVDPETTSPAGAVYRTDKFGRFDFRIEYPKASAHWLTVNIGAIAGLAQTPTRGDITFVLPAADNDYAANGSNAPNQISPYGRFNSSTSCLTQ